MTPSPPRTLFDKLWESHVVHERADGWALLYIDRIFMHEGSLESFDLLEARGRPRRVRRPNQCFSTADHLVPTIGQSRGLSGIDDLEMRVISEAQVRDSHAAGIRLFGIGEPEQGIVHVVGPEQGITQPGLTMICPDSHTTTHGAFGAFAFGVGNSELAHAMITQTIWCRKARSMRIRIEGALRPGVTSKDVALAIIGQIGTAGATGHVLEFDGPVIRGLSMAARMTLCNMAIEAGSRAALIAPDETTIEYLRGRRYAPSGAHWDRAQALWSTLSTDPGAQFDRELVFDAGSLTPMVSWGTSPEDVAAVSGHVPDPASQSDGRRREHLTRALAYMGLSAGQAMTAIPIDRVFIGSCTNSRIEDLRAAADIVRGRKAVVPAWVVPGSGPVKLQAEQEGLAKVFIDAGFEWREPGCSMCLAMNGDIVRPGERCASTSNRNFEGRQGPGARTHLMSPAMAAAAALHGHIIDITSPGKAG
ncbi:MAG: 3-isopropylmalate dehydratase large subunit [Deltaproteobacteria bacterium]|nr:3-isopropylmalate dehydratase large subunit [Deltaproteobacteria bacterium]